MQGSECVMIVVLVHLIALQIDAILYIKEIKKKNKNVCKFVKRRHWQPGDLKVRKR